MPLCPAPPRHLDTYSLLSFPPPDGMPFLLLSCLHASHPCLGLQRAELKKGTFRRRKCGSDRLVLGQWTSSSSSLFPQVGNEKDICSQNSSIGMNKLWLLDTQKSLIQTSDSGVRELHSGISYCPGPLYNLGKTTGLLPALFYKWDKSE